MPNEGIPPILQTPDTRTTPESENTFDFFEMCRREADGVEVYKNESGKLLVAPGGPESTIQDDLLYRVVRTVSFKERFGDWQSNPNESSQVVDERTGEPRIVFHSTRAPIPFEEGVRTRRYAHTLSHDPINVKKDGVPISASYFSSNRKDSLLYAKGDPDVAAAAYPAFLNIRHPQGDQGTTEETDGVIFSGVNAVHYVVLADNQIMRLPFSSLD